MSAHVESPPEPVQPEPAPPEQQAAAAEAPSPPPQPPPTTKHGPKRCGICTSKHRATVDQMLSAGRSVRDIARDIHASRSAVGRHRSAGHHLADQPEDAEPQEDQHESSENSQKQGESGRRARRSVFEGAKLLILEAVLEGHTVASAARRAGVPEKRAQEWARSDEFQAEYSRLVTLRQKAIERRIEAAASVAIRVVIEKAAAGHIDAARAALVAFGRMMARQAPQGSLVPLAPMFVLPVGTNVMSMLLTRPPKPPIDVEARSLPPVALDESLPAPEGPPEPQAESEEDLRPPGAPSSPGQVVRFPMDEDGELRAAEATLPPVKYTANGFQDEDEPFGPR